MTDLKDFLDSAPADLRRGLLEVLDHNARTAARKVTARPAQMRKIRSDEAADVITLIDDPSVLGLLYRREQRFKVRAALRAHHLWPYIAHHDLCTICCELSGKDPHRNRELLLSQPCPEAVARAVCALDNAGLEAAWRQDDLRATLQHSGLFAVTVAKRGVLSSENPHGTWTAPGVIERYLRQEPTASIPLIELALSRASGALPAHWELTDEHWRYLFTHHLPRAFTQKQRPDLATLQVIWPELRDTDRHQVILAARTAAELEALLPRLDGTAVKFTRNEVVALLSQIDRPTREIRMELIVNSRIYDICSYLVGGFGDPPTEAEVHRILDRLLSGADRHENATSLVTDINFWLRSENRPWSVGEDSLLQTLIDRLPVNAMCGHTGAIAGALHRRLWERLDPARHAESVYALCHGWDDTAEALIDTVRRL